MSYFKKNSNRVFLTGMTAPITKEVFFEKMDQIPLFTNLIRVETFYRDRIKENSLREKQPIRTPVFCTCSISNLLFLFKFVYRKREFIDEGFDIKPDVKTGVVIFEMNGLKEEDVLADVRVRIIDALLVA